MVFTEQGVVDIYNQHVIIPVTTDTNNKKSWKTIYVVMNLAKSRGPLLVTDEVLSLWHNLLANIVPQRWELPLAD